jgi:hypothetical protein
MADRIVFLRVATGSAVVLLAGTLSTLPVVVSATPPAAAKHEVVKSRPDALSAMVTARTQRSRVENESARTPTTATYANPNGTWTTEAFAGVVRSKGDDGQWISIDPSVTNTGDGFAPAAVPYDVHFSGGGDRTVGSVRADGGSRVRVE